MRTMLTAAALDAALASTMIAAAPPAWAQAQQVAVAARDMTGTEINQLIYGRTIRGTTGADPYTQTFNANGTVDSTQGGSGRNDGRWGIVGNQVQMTWPDRRAAWGIRTDGSRYFKVFGNGNLSEFTIVR